ncbi:30S ribosomal subunit protein S1 [Wigglesworthia glossinidia endosymbiont of Glossina morsitans morsitans (Yale colony)]|uniref:30S ribosomal protein S1 n=1 Tax=Wigglesworthia glossinidia endosymbiont of Glossina morsitans morsitans (Yale colony) TaxID=1142511 RepID=H6Q4Q4_WIGGL|nr:30S ribosomal protein S1 [Wigglesworthia glossinidia]AFA41114.1 30S ribosomal subunit protein S1 [Wigglesworthia glossinidia endosymbiont of Glossina morsitans morsitans (Yale colony)]
MTESFSQLFKESLNEIQTRPGSLIKGTVISILKDIVLVDAGLKSESAIPIVQFLNSQGELEVKIGDVIDVTLDAIEDGFGETILSREKAKRYAAWSHLEKAHEESTIVNGVINGKVKGGFTVELHGIRAFLPGSLVDIRPIRDSVNLEGKNFEFKVIKLDQKRNNVVVSRRAVIESENSAEREHILNNLQEGAQATGIVKNLTDYGAFIDLGGIDGLLHITDMAWKRVKHPSEIVGMGDEITVKILKFDREKTRVSLGLKQLSQDPWINLSTKYPENKNVSGRVTNLTDYGCFVEIEEGVEGLVHISEMDWTNKNIHPSKVVQIGDIVNVLVLDIDEDRRRISLGLKQCQPNPWKKFSEIHKKGDCVKGKIKSITDFGIFIGLEGGIDGLVHLSDVSWNLSGEEAVKEYKKGDLISAMVLQVDSDRERISLGVKQLLEDPFHHYITKYKKGDIVDGKIIKRSDNIIFVQLESNVDGIIKIPEIYEKNIDDICKKLKNLDTYKLKIINIDRKNRIVNVSFLINTKNKKMNHEKIIQEKSSDSFSNVMTEAFKAATKSD